MSPTKIAPVNTVLRTVEPAPSDWIDTAHSPRFSSAFTRLLPKMTALPASELAAVNVDVEAAVTTLLRIVPGVLAMRGLINETFRAFPAECLDELEDRTLALGHAQALYRAAETPRESLPSLHAAAVAARDTFHADAVALARRGFLGAAEVDKLKSGVGYRDVVFDLMGLVAMLRSHAEKIAGKTAIQAAELDDAERLADRVLVALGERAGQPARVAEAAEQRQRAFTLVSRAYAQVRRAVVYLRWAEGDADAIAPALSAHVGPRSKDDAPDDAAAPAASPAAATKSATNGGAPVAPGLPGAAPFLTTT